MNRSRNRPGRLMPPAFTLVELVVVVLILGILAGIAAPKLIDASGDSEAVAILTNVKLILDAAERYAARHGELPGNARVGEVPSDLAPEYLPERLFTDPTPTGGPLDWDGLGASTAFYGVNVAFVDGSRASDSDLYARLEAIADDGASDTGWIRASGPKILFRYADN